MKLFLSILLFLSFNVANAQDLEFKVLLDSAKSLFKSSYNLEQAEYDKFDYNTIATMLEKAVELNPNSTEARYFLGYTYSRINSRDGRGIVGMNLNTLYKSSEQFEKIIQLSPKYKDEIIILDPYSKLTAEWGSMAMNYWYQNKADSAIWAFQEGKRRGAFNDFTIQVCKSILNTCQKKSILISNGDNLSIPLWYLQIVENYRTDVSVVDISLLNTYWYPRYLVNTKKIEFNDPMEVIDTINYSSWADSIITIEGFSWTVKPSYAEQYLLRGDKVFLSLLKANKFQRQVTFTTSFAEDYMLSLKEYTTSKVLVSELYGIKISELDHNEFIKHLTTALKLSKYLNLNSQDAHIQFDNFRYDALRKMYYYMNIGELNKSRELLKLMEKYANDKTYPFYSENGKSFYDNMKLQLQK